jgi:CheY-like chemotaxis protein
MATILIVDDEKPVCEFLVAAFEQEGHQVLEASPGRQALNVTATTLAHPAIVMSGVMMPLVGGVELCRLLKSDPSTADTPVILMSAGHFPASTNSEADVMIGKLFDLDRLEALVHRLLSVCSRAVG